MADNMIQDLMEAAKRGFNVLLVGEHGVGKTEMIRSIAAQLSIKMKYFSAPTLDPWADFVGVPIPTGGTPDIVKVLRMLDDDLAKSVAKSSWNLDDTVADKVVASIKNFSENRILEFIRPGGVLDAEWLFFDEMNRAHLKVLNALLEATQFKSVNGDKFTNLRMVWAAINPPEQGYQVVQLDPALLSRFHLTYTIVANPSVDYFVSIGIGKAVAETVVKWWRALDKKMQRDVPPRTLEYICRVHESSMDIKHSLPFGVSAPIAQLQQLLKTAANSDLIDRWDLDNPVKRKQLLKEMKDNLPKQMQVSTMLEDRRFPRIFTYVEFVEAMDKEVKKKFFKKIEWRMKRFLPDLSEANYDRVGPNADAMKRFVEMAVEAGLY